LNRTPEIEKEADEAFATVNVKTVKGKMKTREEVTEFIEQQLNYKITPTKPKMGRVHYGRQELRDLMDFIYYRTPKTKAQEIQTPMED